MLPTCDDRLIWDIWLSVHNLSVLILSDELKIFPLIEKQALNAEEIATKLSLSPRSTEAILGMLSCLGLLTKRNNKLYLTEASRNFLLPQSHYYWGGMLNLLRNMPLTLAVLKEALRKDNLGRDGKEIWESHEISPEQARVFTSAMHSHSFAAAMGMAKNGDFTGVKNLLDVGGGSGCFCIALAQFYPDTSFTVMELPVVCKILTEYTKKYKLEEKIKPLPLNMFKDPWPKTNDAIFFSNIFHDWSKEKCKFLAKQSFEALPSQGRIYIHEMLLDDDKSGPYATTSFSLTMLITTEGKQFTAKEIIEILESVGFANITITNTYGYYSLITGLKP